MAYFLTREDGRQPVGGRSMAGRPPPVPAPSSFFTGGPSPEDAHPVSPLSRFVQEGYAPGGMLGAPGQGFDAGVASQWKNNVQQTTSAHQQRNDPNYAERKVKSNGYRISQAPGGGSSLSLAWDADNPEPAQQGRRNRGAGADRCPDHSVGGAAIGGGGGILGGGAWGAPQGPGSAGGEQRPNYRTPSPGAGGRGIVRSSSREGGGMAACLGGGQQSQPSSREGVRAGGVVASAAYDSRAAPYGGAGNFSAAPPPMPGGRHHTEATSLAFGNRVDNNSSNAYACGANQNCGNGITDRRTTTVLQPPGGRSQISFG